MRAVAIDAVDVPAVETPGRRARRFVGRVAAVPLSPEGGGCGIGFRGESPFARVTTLQWHGRNLQTVAVNARHELVSA